MSVLQPDGRTRAQIRDETLTLRDGSPVTRRSHRLRTPPVYARLLGSGNVGLLLADVASVGLAALLAAVPVVPAVCFLVALLLTRAVARVYRSRLRLTWIDDIPRLLLTLVSATVIVLVGFEVLVGVMHARALAELAVLTALLGSVLQVGSVEVARRARWHWDLGRRTVIVGEGEVATRLADLMKAHRDFGLRPVAVMELRNRADHLTLTRLVRRSHAQAIVLAFSPVREAELLDEVIHATRSGVMLLVVPRLFEVHHDGIDVERLFGFPLVRFRQDPTAQPLWWIKRLADIVLSAVLLVLVSPLLAIGMLLVLVDTGRPIFFRQVRVGLGGTPITIYKLRSLRPVPESQSNTTWDINNDARVSVIGRFLRRTSMDELPQLFNILRGDMSFVGPRPERPGFAERFSQEHVRYWARHRVPVGLTGLAQVNGLRGDTSIEDRARFDNYYIANWSLWLDIRIALQTIKEVILPARIGEVRPWEQGRPTVVHVTQPTSAGVSRVVLNLVADQVARGWDVHVACPAQGDLWAELAETGATPHRWEAVRSPGRTTFAEARRLRMLLNRLDPDVVHLHSAKAGLAGRLAIRGRIPTMFQPHAWSFEAVTGPMRMAALAWERLAVRWTDVTVCVSSSEQALGAELRCLARRDVIVPNGVDLDRFYPRDSLDARAELGLVDGPWVVCVGRVDVQKGQDLLLKAWPNVLARHPGAQLAVVGDGPMLESLQAHADESVLFVGKSREVPLWLAAADVVVMPSRWEGMPLLLLEAMASSRAAVAFDVNGVRDCLGAHGRICPPGDLSAFAAGINDYLDSSGLREADGLRLRRRAEEHFTLERAGQGVSEIVSTIGRMPAFVPRSVVDLRSDRVGTGTHEGVVRPPTDKRQTT